MAQIFLNNCYAVLAQGITATDTQIELSSMNGFPVSLGIGDFFLLTLYADTTRYGENIEVVKVTGLAGTTATVERGFEGIAVLHAAGERAEARLTAETLRNLTPTWEQVSDKPTEFPPESHGHVIAEVTGLTAALAAKTGIADVVDGLASVETNKPLSANQGRVLKGLIDSLNTLVASDDTTLDELQEIVNYIKVNRTELENLGIGAIAGLQAALDGKAAASHTHTLGQVTDAGTAASINVPATGNAAVGEVVKGDDTRLSDARAPTSHTHAASEITSGVIADARLPSNAHGSRTVSVSTPSGGLDGDIWLTY